MSYGEGTPDWAAMAEAHEAGRRRRRRLWWGAGAGLGALAIAAAVAVGIGGTGRAAPEALQDPRPPGPVVGGPLPTFPSKAPAPDPRRYLADARVDRAPLGPGPLFPGTRATVSGRTYLEGGGDTTADCAAHTDPALAAVLKKHGCTALIRSTYRRGSVQVTVGVAVFATEAQATAARAARAHGGVRALPGARTKPFCAPKTVCRRTADSYGRYLYVTLSGFTGNKNATKKDRSVYRAGDDLSAYTFRQLHHRAETVMAAASPGPSGPAPQP
ncbi:hypothetical protein [Streptomyces sp. NPDC089919]|uniref:hypothetical protein n=1 Tax=Streptomyces sp. NPDC089919 TaxID=3155188 RepID=UPI00341FE169